MHRLQKQNAYQKEVGMSDKFSFDPPPSVPPAAGSPPPPSPPRPVFSSTPPPEPQKTSRGCSFWLGWLLAFMFLGTTGLLVLTITNLSVRDVVREAPYEAMIEVIWAEKHVSYLLSKEC